MPTVGQFLNWPFFCFTAPATEITDSNEGEISTDSSIGLYVVENGKEYPLIPLKERKSMFENGSQVSTSNKIVKLFCWI